MGTDFSIRPVGVPVATPVIRPLPDAASGGVATELPPPQATTAPDPSAAANNDLQADGDLSREVSIDRAAGSIVYSVVDNRTSQVISQYPDDARLRARAYVRSIEDAKLDKSLHLKLDQTA